MPDSYRWVTPDDIARKLLVNKYTLNDYGVERTYYVEDGERLGIPLFANENTPEFPVGSGVPGRFGEPVYEPRDYQIPAVAALCSGGRGILKLDPGRGKTFTSLYSAWLMGEPTLVVVHSKTLLAQWRDAITRLFGVASEDIGQVRGDPETWDWRGHGITLAMLQTLATHYRRRPPEMEHWFGTCIYDEVHHMQAEWFSRGIAYSHHRRWGLSATPFAGSSLDQAIEWNFGDVLYDEEDTPYQVPLRIEVWPLEAPDSYEPVRDGYTIEVRASLSRSRARTDLALRIAQSRVAEARALMVQHPQVKTLEVMARRFRQMTSLDSEVGVLHGRVPDLKRPEQISKPILFGLQHASVTQEGFDKPEVDHVVVVGPCTGFRAFHQILGRAGRLHGDKESATVAFVIDAVPRCIELTERRCEEAARKGAEIKWMPTTRR